MSWLSEFFGGGDRANPADSALKYLEQIPGQYTNPSMYNDISSQYKQSPGYKFRLKEGLDAINNSAAAGGMLGSNQHQFQSGKLAEDLADQDFNNYWNQRMGLNEDMGNLFGQKAQYGYAGAAGKNQDRANQIQQLLKLLGIGGGAIVGGLAGGPMGSLYGASLFK